MKPPNKLRNILLAPLVYLAAVILLVEEWLWDAGARCIAFLAAWPPLRALETRVRALPPYGALCVFALPGILLFPVKLLALFAIGHGHAAWGVTVLVTAKVGGAALVARLYALTKPSLLSLAWFARWHDQFIDLKDRLLARLRATRAMRQVKTMAGALKASARAMAAWVRTRIAAGGPGWRPARAMRRYIALRRARRRP